MALSTYSIVTIYISIMQHAHGYCICDTRMYERHNNRYTLCYYILSSNLKKKQQWH